MKTGPAIAIYSAMKLGCPNKCHLKGKVSVKRGFFRRSSDSRILQRYWCKGCNLTYSAATFSPFQGQKKRRSNTQLLRLLCSGVSQRRSAELLHIDKKTVTKKFHFLAERAREKNQSFLKRYEKSPASSIVFDHMETFEHTKLKPVSIFVAVEKGTRKILSLRIAPMAAKGLIAKKSRKKYGPRKDETGLVLRQAMVDLRELVEGEALIESDQNPHYLKEVKKFFPKSEYRQYKGRRGCVVGQGELKSGAWDPLFSLNHTCAMIRANLNRLFRRTWCTTKTLKGLQDHLDLYMAYHNQVLTA